MYFSYTPVVLGSLCYGLTWAAPESQKAAITDVNIGHEILKAAFGPKESWPKQFAKDVLPAGAKLEGKPFTDTDVFSYGPFSINVTQRELMRRREAELMGRDVTESLHKRCDEDKVIAGYQCYSGANWVPIMQIQGGAASFCNDHGNMVNRVATGQGKQYYLIPGTSSSYDTFKNQNGQKFGVYYEVAQWNGFNWDNCWNALSQSGWFCQGSNADTAGGWNGWFDCEEAWKKRDLENDEQAKQKRDIVGKRQDVRYSATYGYKPTWLNSYYNVKVVPY